MTRREVLAVLTPFVKFLEARSRGEPDDTAIADTAVVELGVAAGLPRSRSITFGDLRAAKAMYDEIREPEEASG